MSYLRIICPNNVYGMANGEDLDQTASYMMHKYVIYTFLSHELGRCKILSLNILRIICKYSKYFKIILHQYVNMHIPAVCSSEC